MPSTQETLDDVGSQSSRTVDDPSTSGPVTESEPGIDTADRDASVSSDTTDSDNVLVLSYKNERGNAVVVRKYQNLGDVVRVVDRELMYNYRLEEWDTTRRFTYDYELCDDEKTLAGDGSNWRGTGRNWQEWFTTRHYELLRVRFQNDEIPDDIDSIADHDPVDRPVTEPPAI